MTYIMLACAPLQDNTKQCSPGQYQDQEGSRSCKTCPAGSRCSQSGLTTPGTRCAGGMFAVAGSQQCEACPENHYCPEGAGYPVKCPSGKTSAAKATECA